MPDGYAAKRLPDGTMLDNAAGSYSSSYTLGDDGVLEVVRQLRIEQPVFQASEYPALSDLLRTMSADSRTILSAHASGAE